VSVMENGCSVSCGRPPDDRLAAGGQPKARQAQATRRAAAGVLGPRDRTSPPHLPRRAAHVCMEAMQRVTLPQVHGPELALQRA
jgi:hypothetical protein